jgi:hypothetical protein
VLTLSAACRLALSANSASTQGSAGVGRCVTRTTCRRLNEAGNVVQQACGQSVGPLVSQSGNMCQAQFACSLRVQGDDGTGADGGSCCCVFRVCCLMRMWAF